MSIKVTKTGLMAWHFELTGASALIPYAVIAFVFFMIGYWL